MLRNILALLAGLIGAVVVIGAVQYVASLVYPLPAGIDVNDSAAITAAVANMPAGAFVMVLIGYALGTLGGTWTAARLAQFGSRRLGLEHWWAVVATGNRQCMDDSAPRLVLGGPGNRVRDSDMGRRQARVGTRGRKCLARGELAVLLLSLTLLSSHLVLYGNGAGLDSLERLALSLAYLVEQLIDLTLLFLARIAQLLSHERHSFLFEFETVSHRSRETCGFALSARMLHQHLHRFVDQAVEPIVQRDGHGSLSVGFKSQQIDFFHDVADGQSTADASFGFRKALQPPADAFPKPLFISGKGHAEGSIISLLDRLAQCASIGVSGHDIRASRWEFLDF